MEPKTPEALLRSGAEALGLRLDEEEIRNDLDYLAALKRWNRTTNLTAYREDRALIEHLFLDSLMGTRVLESVAGKRMADLGTGGGFPGIPIKVHIPALHLTLIESSKKKAAFLVYLRGLLGLEETAVLDERVEDLAIRAEFQGQFDIIVTRALAKPPVVIRLARPLLGPGGLLLLYLSPSGAAALDAAPDWISRAVHYQLPFSGIRRTLVTLTRAL